MCFNPYVSRFNVSVLFEQDFGEKATFRVLFVLKLYLTFGVQSVQKVANYFYGKNIRTENI